MVALKVSVLRTSMPGVFARELGRELEQEWARECAALSSGKMQPLTWSPKSYADSGEISIQLLLVTVSGVVSLKNMWFSILGVLLLDLPGIPWSMRVSAPGESYLSMVDFSIFSGNKLNLY